MSQKTLRTELTARLHEALREAGLPAENAEVVPAADTRFGDYQTNAAMTLAKSRKANPRQLAQAILEKLAVSDLSDPPTLAGAGFINFSLSLPALAGRVAALARDERLGVPPAAKPETIVIDFSSPNVAKPMHVGHIRSTLIGDCLARVARALGHKVITDNHLGDWGTQFGKVIYGWKHLLNPEALAKDAIAELVRLYRDVNALEETDPEIKRRVREELVKLQRGDAENRAIWQQTVDLSWQEFDRLYALLEIEFDERLGESFYNDALEPLVKRLRESGLAEVSEGALCIFFRDLPALADKPCLVRKSDGGFN
ncbi:MAG TPA: arginine--tRNA ligase, partial [Chthoniobacterales bacterium]